MSDRLDEIRARLQAATPGPWCAENCGEKSNEYVVGVAFAADDENCERPLSGWPKFYDGDGNEIAARTDMVAAEMATRADADFIAHAPEDIAYLLGEVARLSQGEP